ncbi:hypothetical protein [Streptomyces sennicomposti]
MRPPSPTSHGTRPSSARTRSSPEPPPWTTLPVVSSAATRARYSSGRRSRPSRAPSAVAACRVRAVACAVKGKDSAPGTGGDGS